MNAFTVREACNSNAFIIGLTEEFHQKCPKLIAEGSYSILASRLLGINYDDFLRYCAVNGGTLKGRTGFPHCTFEKKTDALNICNKINKEWDKVYEVIKEKM